MKIMLLIDKHSRQSPPGSLARKPTIFCLAPSGVHQNVLTGLERELVKGFFGQSLGAKWTWFFKQSIRGRQAIIHDVSLFDLRFKLICGHHFCFCWTIPAQRSEAFSTKSTRKPRQKIHNLLPRPCLKRRSSKCFSTGLERQLVKGSFWLKSWGDTSLVLHTKYQRQGNVYDLILKVFFIFIPYFNSCRPKIVHPTQSLTKVK